jgi:hypothetical protein
MPKKIAHRGRHPGDVGGHRQQDRRHSRRSRRFETNALCQPGTMKVLNTPVDLSTIKVPTFATGG